MEVALATRTRLSLSTLSVLLVAAPAIAALPQMNPDQAGRVQQSINHVMGMRAQLGLNGDAAMVQTLVRTDRLGQTHTHLQQMYRGIKVWGGGIITHMDRNGNFLPPTSFLKADINLNTTASLRTGECLAIAHQDLSTDGAFTSEPTSELVVYPVMAEVHARPGQDATAYDQQVVRYVLAYHLHTSLLHGAADTRQMDYMIDAQTGAVLKKWSTLQTAAATGTGNSQYSGTVNISANSTGSGYELRDMLRGGTTVLDMGNSTTSSGTLYTNATNTWGDSNNFFDDGTSGSTSGVTGQTTAVDALYGFEATWDYYKNVHGRNGIDNLGTATSLRVHYDLNYDNAYWDDTCFCMTFGDGSAPAAGGFHNLTAIDVVGHELSHGVCANSVSGGLTYSGESGGINEADSDINGTFVVFYGYNGDTGSVVPNTIPTANLNGYVPWQIGPQLSNPPLRYMYHPSLDNRSADYWYSGVGTLDVHLSSGPANRMVYFLAQGATTSGDTSTSVNVPANGVVDANFLPNGMAGIGNDHAAHIWYRALTTYMNSNETYAQLRTDCLSAAGDLYGTASAEYAAVQNAFHGINVGAAATTIPNTVTASITTPSTNVTIATGTAQAFAGTGTDSSPSATLTYGWNFGDGTTATGASASHTFTNAGTTAVTYTVTFTATDGTGATSSATRLVTVNPATVTPNTVTASITTPSTNVTIATGTTQAFAGTGTDSSPSATLTYGWNFGDGTTATGASASHTFTNAGTTAVTYTVTFTATDGTGASGSATRLVTVNPAPGGGVPTELILNGGFESGATSWASTSGVIGQNGPSEPANTGTWDAWLDGYGSSHTDYVYQQVSIPSNATSAVLSFYLHIDTAETATTPNDQFTILVQDVNGVTLATLGTFSNLDAAAGYTLHTYDLSPYKGLAIQLMFNGVEDTSLQTSFVLDDVSVKVQ